MVTVLQQNDKVINEAIQMYKEKMSRCSHNSRKALYEAHCLAIQEAADIYLKKGVYATQPEVLGVLVVSR